MSSVLYVPFNFNPVSTTIKTSAYTVPVGKYARAVLFFSAPKSIVQQAGSTINIASDTITVNGVEVLRSKEFQLQLDAGASFRCPRMDGLNSSGLLSDGLTFQHNSASPALSIYIYTGHQANSVSRVGIGSTDNSIFSVSGSSYTSYFAVIHNIPDQIELWLKAGDVINGSGSWRAIVTEFNEV